MAKRRDAVSVDTSSVRAAPRRAASREIVEHLRQQIAGGVLAGGERLPSEADLAAAFGASQPTVREALRALEAIGLIDVRHGSGAYVTADSRRIVASSLHTAMQMDRVGIVDIVEMRRALAAYSARRVVRFATDHDLDRIAVQEQALVEAAKTADFRKIADAAVAFQVSVSAAARNPVLLAIERVLAELLVRLQVEALSKRSPTFWTDWSLQFAGDRAELIRAFRARDEQAAESAMGQYLDRQRERFSADPALAEARVSDPAVLEVIQAFTQQSRI